MRLSRHRSIPYTIIFFVCEYMLDFIYRYVQFRRVSGSDGMGAVVLLYNQFISKYGLHVLTSNCYHTGRTMRKRVFGHMRTAKTQISLRIRAVWSGPSLSANRIIGYYRMYDWRINVQMILCACSGWSESAHLAHVRRHFSITKHAYIILTPLNPTFM